LPIIDLLRNYCDISDDNDERKRREKVARKIVMLDRALEDTLPYLFTLLAIAEGDDPLAQMDGQIKKRRTQEAIKRILLRESLNQPLIVIFEDLHWMDAESLEVLNLLADSLESEKILLLVNYRPNYRHEWDNKNCYIQLLLDPLREENAEEMLRALLGSAEGLNSLKRLIIEKAQGNPFFMEEIVQGLFEEKALVSNGETRVTRPLSDIHVPGTVQAMLGARIDRLPPEKKELMQTFAVLGQAFTLSQLKAVFAKAHAELQQMLAELQLAEFIYELPAPGDIAYNFKHALTREVVYNSILLERRRQIHERAAQEFEALYALNLSDHYDDLAHHYSRSGNAVKAANYLHLAAQQAISRSAYGEGASRLTTALEFLGRQPATPDRDRAELAVRLRLAVCMMWSMRGGPGAPEVVQMLEQAHVLCTKVGDDPTLFQILENLSFSYGGPAIESAVSWDRVHSVDKELLDIASRLDDPALMGRALFAHGRTLMWQGIFTAAREEFDRASEFSTAVSSRRELSLGDWRVRNHSLASFTLWILGYPEKAVASSREALSIARRTTLPADLILALNWRVKLNLLLRNGQVACLRSDEALRVASKHGLSVWGLGFDRGQALTLIGQTEEGLSEVLRTRSELEVGVVRPMISAGLAEVFLAAFRPSDGLEAVDEGLEFCRGSGSRAFEADLQRLRGELLLMADQTVRAEAEQSFRDAIKIVHSQCAKSWELRATLSLAPLLMKQGRRDEAHAMLAGIYGWFTEGFDTRDLQEAKQLLHELDQEF
jgi:hypothetical protein